MTNTDMGALMLIVMAVAYFWPTLDMICSYPKHALGIFAMNLFFGWTFIGWILCYVAVAALKAKELKLKQTV